MERRLFFRRLAGLLVSYAALWADLSFLVFPWDCVGPWWADYVGRLGLVPSVSTGITYAKKKRKIKKNILYSWYFLFHRWKLGKENWKKKENKWTNLLMATKGGERWWKAGWRLSVARCSRWFVLVEQLQVMEWRMEMIFFLEKYN